MTPKEILKKKPFRRMLPFTQMGGYTSGHERIEVGLPENQYTIVPQERLLAELNPSAHDVNSISYRKDKYLKDDDGNIIGHKEVARVAVALQQIISTKQKIHLTANPIKFTLTEPKRTEEKEKDFVEFKQAWIDKNMHVYLSKFIESWLETADGALYMYRDGKKVGCKEFSFKNGDVLCPHYDYYDNLDVFGRLYQSVDDKGKTISMLDVFDRTHVTTYKKRGLFGRVFSMGEWTMVGEKRAHGFPDVPIVYKSSEDACWGHVQSLIDSFEEALSRMSENNRYYANSILFVSGNVGEMPNRDDDNKTIQGEIGTDAKFLATPESNQAQMNELDVLLKQIFLGTFTVNVSPDSVKSSGDLPGITVKLLFSPATEKAISSAKELDGAIDRLIKLFKHGYGIESGRATQINELKLRGEIKIYTPENDAEIAQIINDGIFSKALSRETGSEIYPVAVNGEKERVDSQIEEEKAAEIAGSLNLNT